MTGVMEGEKCRKMWKMLDHQESMGRLSFRSAVLKSCDSTLNAGQTRDNNNVNKRKYNIIIKSAAVDLCKITFQEVNKKKAFKNCIMFICAYCIYSTWLYRSSAVGLTDTLTATESSSKYPIHLLQHFWRVRRATQYRLQHRNRAELAY